MSGLWKIGYRYSGKTASGTMQIQQNNKNFSGQGQDEQSGAAFKIEHGKITGDEVIFLKRYDSRPNQSVQYHGRFSYLPADNGEVPYMGGDFSFETNGETTVGEWEAAMDAVKVSPAAAKANKAPEPEVQREASHETVPGHNPDLSGKWSLAYEYNFKTMHSTMFLEQDGSNIGGHGTDANTKEKFVIKKGWYNYPHLTLIRQYPDRSAGNNLMTFKGEVSIVTDKDYSGPYISGKTQGGGEWEAERVN